MICCPLTLALGNGADKGSILGSLVIPVTVSQLAYACEMSW